MRCARPPEDRRPRGPHAEVCIKAPWSLNEEQFRSATTFMPRPPSRRDLKLRDEDLILRGSPQSAIGRAAAHHGVRRRAARAVRRSSASSRALLQAATKYGLATQVAAPVGGVGWRLTGTAITLWPQVRAYATAERDNLYFRGLYEEIARLLAEGGGALFGFEGREHTAQVEIKRASLRKARFRFGPGRRRRSRRRRSC